MKIRRIVHHKYLTKMAGVRAGWVTLGFRGNEKTPYVCVTLFTIGRRGANCTTIPVSFYGLDGIRGFSQVVSVATVIHDGGKDAELPYFASWHPQENPSEALLHGDGVYHTYGRAQPVWCNSMAEVWNTVKEKLEPYKDAEQVFTWLYDAINARLASLSA